MKPVYYNLFYYLTVSILILFVIIIDSAPSLGVYYFVVVSVCLSVCMSVCLSVTLLLQIASLFCFSMESSHFVAR